MNLIKAATGRYINADKIELICSPNGAFVQNEIKKAKEKGKAYNLSGDKKTLAVIFYENSRLYLSPTSVDTLLARIAGKETEADKKTGNGNNKNNKNNKRRE